MIQKPASLPSSERGSKVTEFNPQQVIIDEVYAAIDLGNKNLVALGADFRIERWISMTHLPDKTKTGATQTGNVCSNCGGETIRTGTCETCLNCGQSEGCG